jgi:hypothetical protein
MIKVAARRIIEKIQGDKHLKLNASGPACHQSWSSITATFIMVILQRYGI